MSDSDVQDEQPAKRSRKSSSQEAHGTGDSSAEAREPQSCIPCHGSGKVLSNLGDRMRQVTCPWCRGGGVRLTGMDAQEWQQEQAALERH